MESPKVILVTGSSSGFGRLTVETLARQGHTVFAGIRATSGKNAQIAAELTALADQHQLKLHIVELDVTEDQSVAEAVQAILDTAGRIDVVVNNAGVYYMGPLEAFTPEQAQTQFDSNVYSILRVNRAVIPAMRAQGSGLLVQVGSILGRFAVPFSGLYSASKFALEGLTEAYHYELAPHGIEVSIVEPGTFPTNMGSNRVMAADQGRYEPYLAGIATLAQSYQALSALGEPQQVANAITDLIAHPTGSRPLRVVVAVPNQEPPALRLNQVFDAAVPEFAQSLNITELFGLTPVPQSTS